MSSEEVQKPKEEIQLDEQKEEDIQPPPENEDLNYKELFFMHPSQKNKKKKDFTEYSRVDMTLLNKKRERKQGDEEANENNNKLDEDKNINGINKEEEKEEKKDGNIEKNDEQNNNNNEEEIKENDLENNLPKELLELIEERKDKEPFTAADFEKYKIFKKLNINFSK